VRFRTQYRGLAFPRRSWPQLLGRPRFADEVLDWVRDALHASHADERHEHEAAIKRHQAEYKRLQDRINAMDVDKLDELVDMAFYE
jgi:site-specific DNA recombinase